MPESLTNQFISDFYTSLLHLSGAELGDSLNDVFDGAGNSTGLALSGRRVVINNYIYPEGPSKGPTEWLDTFFPVGCLQLTLDDINPQTRIAGTTWVIVAEGKFLVGVGGHKDKNQDYRKFCEESKPPGTGQLDGEYMTQLTVANLPPHRHDTNVGATDVFVSAGAGISNGQVFQATGVGTTNSTVAWSRQQRKRNELGAAAGWNFNNDFGNRFSDRDENGQPVPPNPQDIVRRSLDLNFMLGSAATWPTTRRDEYLNNPVYGYKEVIGLWNGETRFVASVIPEGVGPDWDFNAYEFCIEKGAVDVGSAQAGELAANQSVTPVIVKGTEQINYNEGGSNIQESTEVGEGTKHNNIPPSYGIYVWQRVT